MSVLLPRGVEDHLRCRCTRDRHAHGLRLALKPNVPKDSTKTAIIRPSPRGDRDTMHASSAYSIPQIARDTHSSAVSGPIVDGFSCRYPIRRVPLQKSTTVVVIIGFSVIF